MGMYCMATNSSIELPFNQTNTCATLHIINNLTEKSNAIDGPRQVHSDILRQHLSMHKGKKIVICMQIKANQIRIVTHFPLIISNMLYAILI